MVTELSLAVLVIFSQKTMFVPVGTTKAGCDIVWAPCVKLNDLKSRKIVTGPAVAWNLFCAWPANCDRIWLTCV